MNLGAFLDNAVEQYQDAPFIQFYDRTVSYEAFGKGVDKLANSLEKLGVNPGDFVHVLVQNSPETLMSYFAIQKIGAVAGPINGWWKAPEVEYLLNDSQGRVLIVEDQYLPILDGIRGKCPHLETVIEVSENPRPEHVSFARLLAEGADRPVVCQSHDDDVAYIFYTSGTTGNPKGVLLTHKNVLADVDGATRALNLDLGMTILVFLPLFHVNAMLTCTFSIGMGFQMVLRRQFSAGEFWEVVDKYKVHFWSAVPAVYQILLTDPGRQKYDLSSLQFGICGAAPLTSETFHNFQNTFGIPIVEGYGLTEATCVSTINPRDGVRKVGSIGLPLPGQVVKILDEDGRECDRGKPGEICIGGDVVMKGYYNRPEETAAAVIDGFLHSGDVGYMDEDGYIFIVDRLKDMIIRGGENIYPKEIDNVLAAHPGIIEAAVIGVPDDTMGEEIKAFIVASDDNLTEEDVIAFCRQNLADFKVPRYIEILDGDFPRNPIGKVIKKELRDWGLTPRPKQEKQPQVTVADIFGTMEARVNPEGVAGLTADYGYVITGEGGGEWTVSVRDGKVKVLEGLNDPQVTSTISAKDWIAVTLGTLDGMTAFSSGRLKVEGDMGLMMKAARLFKKYTPPAEPQVTVADIFGTMESRVNPEGVAGVTGRFGYIVTGEGGGEWTVSVRDGKVKVLEGLHDPDVISTISAKDWIAVTLGTLDGMTAFTSGRLKVEGDMGLLTKATRFFKKYTPPSGAAREAPREEHIRLSQVLSIPQRFATGPIMGKFLNALKEKKILANKCPSCGRLQLPPREVCAECRVRVDEFVEVGPLGRLTHSYDITYYASPDPLTGESRETPYISAHFLLDGCQGHETFWHELNPEQLGQVKRGARVRPVWEEERTGSVTDIKYFEIIDEGEDHASR